MNSVASRHRTLWRWLVLGAFAVLALAGLILSILQGVAAITPVDVIHILWQPSVRTADQIIWNIRLPRTLTGALVGANLALSGAILQAVMRNPLADPHIIGISSGAGLAGIVVLIVWPAYLFWMTPAAFLGAMAAGGLRYGCQGSGGSRPHLSPGLERRHPAGAHHPGWCRRVGLPGRHYFGHPHFLQ